MAICGQYSKIRNYIVVTMDVHKIGYRVCMTCGSVREVRIVDGHTSGFFCHECPGQNELMWTYGQAILRFGVKWW